MVTTDGKGAEEKQWYSIHSHRSRLVIYSPEPDFFIYVVGHARIVESGHLDKVAEHHPRSQSALNPSISIVILQVPSRTPACRPGPL